MLTAGQRKLPDSNLNWSGMLWNIIKLRKNTQDSGEKLKEKFRHDLQYAGPAVLTSFILPEETVLSVMRLYKYMKVRTHQVHQETAAKIRMTKCFPLNHRRTLIYKRKEMNTIALRKTSGLQKNNRQKSTARNTNF